MSGWSRAALAFAALAGAGQTVRAAVVPFYWDIGYTTANPDGLFDRRVIGVNGTWPPPPLIVQSGDTIQMNVHNSLDVPTSLHHHGMFFNKTSFYDGAVGVTQCGIPPGADFQYLVDTSLQTGTYWVHSHYNGQLVDGLRAPVVILPPNATENPAVSYQEEYTIVLGDWYHDEHQPLVDHFVSKANPGGPEPIPNSAILYFVDSKGQYLPGFTENATLPFTPGTTYRIRIVNAGAFSMFFFKMGGHEMQVIEVDGTDVDPYPVDTLTVTVAQRYSVLVTARNDSSPSNYQISANMDGDMFDGYDPEAPDALKINFTSTIGYPNAVTTVPAEDFQPWDYTSQNDTDFAPIIKQGIFPATVSLELGVFFDTFADGTNRAAFNNITWSPPIAPTVMTVNSMTNVTNPAIYGPQTHAIVLNHMDVVELRVVNWDAGKHPFHLHGHKFQIVAKQQDVNVDSSEIDENQTNPVRRDTVQIPSQGSATLRFVVDNPGIWLFHCHIDWHLSSGLALVFVAAPEIVQATMPVPQFMLDQCAAQGLPNSGNAAGKFSQTDLSGAPYGPFPQHNGFHGKGIGALFACVFSAVLGVATMVWYVTGEQFDQEEMEEEERARQEKKAAKGGGLAKRAFNRVTVK